MSEPLSNDRSDEAQAILARTLLSGSLEFWVVLRRLASELEATFVEHIARHMEEFRENTDALLSEVPERAHTARLMPKRRGESTSLVYWYQSNPPRRGSRSRRLKYVRMNQRKRRYTSSKLTQIAPNWQVDAVLGAETSFRQCRQICASASEMIRIATTAIAREEKEHRVDLDETQRINAAVSTMTDPEIWSAFNGAAHSEILLRREDIAGAMQEFRARRKQLIDEDPETRSWEGLTLIRPGTTDVPYWSRRRRPSGTYEFPTREHIRISPGDGPAYPQSRLAEITLPWERDLVFRTERVFQAHRTQINELKALARRTESIVSQLREFADA